MQFIVTSALAGIRPWSGLALIAFALVPACLSVDTGSCSQSGPRNQLPLPVTESVPVDAGTALRKLGYTVTPSGTVHIVREFEVEESYIGVGIVENASASPEPFIGVRVQTVEAGSPAEETGVQTGDVILSLDGEMLSSTKRFEYLIKNHAPNEPASLEVSRFDARKTLAVPIGKRKVQQADYQGFDLPVHDDSDHSGMKLGEITPAFANYLPENARQGAVILEVATGGPAYYCELRAGDIITKLGPNNTDLAEQMVVDIGAAVEEDRTIPMQVVRGKYQFNATLEPVQDLDRPSRLTIPFVLQWDKAPAETCMNFGMFVANYQRQSCYDTEGHPYDEWNLGLALRLINYESRRDSSKLTLLWLIPWEF